MRMTTTLRAWNGREILTSLVLQHLNRLQNTNDVLLADVKTGAVRNCPRGQRQGLGRRRRRLEMARRRQSSFCGSASRMAGGTFT